MRTAQQLVAAEEHQVGAGDNAVAGDRFALKAETAEVDERTAADVVNYRQAVLFAQTDQVSQGHGLSETRDAIVARMHLHECPGIGADGLLVVGQARDVSRPNLAQHGAADRHDFRNAKATADLDQLPAREDDFLSLAKSTQGNHRGGGVVIDGRGGLGAGQAANPLADGQLP